MREINKHRYKKDNCIDNGIAGFGGLRRELINFIDAAQKPVQVMIKGYSNPDAVEIRLNGEPVYINQDSTYTGNIETILQFVADKDKNDLLTIRNSETSNQLAQYESGSYQIDLKLC